MTKQELIQAFGYNHKEMIDYVNSLKDEQFTYSHSGKWTAGQLHHFRYFLKALTV